MTQKAQKLPRRDETVEITGLGGPEVLQLREVDEPAIADDEVPIRVDAAGVNYADGSQRLSKHPPPKGFSLLPGIECSGTIIAVSKFVDRWNFGDQLPAYETEDQKIKQP